MDLGLLHNMCKQESRTVFNEYKRIVEIELFDFDNKVKQDMQNLIKQSLFPKTTNAFVTKYNLTETQLKIVQETQEQYRQIVLKTVINYNKRFY